MTKKDYEKIAAVFAGTMHHLRVAASGGEADQAMMKATVLNAMCMADMLEVDNPRFNRERFLKACGVS